MKQLSKSSMGSQKTEEEQAVTKVVTDKINYCIASHPRPFWTEPKSLTHNKQALYYWAIYKAH